MKESALILDLEGTMIDSWGYKRLLQDHVHAISLLVAQTKCTSRVRLGLMSWAVLDGSDLEVFYTALKQPLEEALGACFDPELTRTMDGWIDLVGELTGFRPERAMVRALYDKPSLLFWLRRAALSQLPSTLCLVDDEIPHGDQIISPQRLIHLINVHDLAAESA